MQVPGHPGAVIRGLWLDGESAESAADRIGVAVPEFERLLDGKCPIAHDMARKMAASGWSTASFWMRLQENYDRGQERLRQAAA